MVLDLTFVARSDRFSVISISALRGVYISTGGLIRGGAAAKDAWRDTQQHVVCGDNKMLRAAAQKSAAR